MLVCVPVRCSKYFSICGYSIQSYALPSCTHQPHTTFNWKWWKRIYHVLTWKREKTADPDPGWCVRAQGSATYIKKKKQNNFRCHRGISKLKMQELNNCLLIAFYLRKFNMLGLLVETEDTGSTNDKMCEMNARNETNLWTGVKEKIAPFRCRCWTFSIFFFNFPQFFCRCYDYGLYGWCVPCAYL